MGLLVGLPLKLFHFLFVVLRLVWPLLLALLIYWLVQRKRRQAGGFNRSAKQEKSASDFNGPVVEVEYRVLEDEEKGEH